jgi:hypothetical protein
MAKIVDRNVEYMKEMWGTTSLVTDYNKNLIREITYDDLIDKNIVTEDPEITESESYNDWDYGIEPRTIID